MDRVRALAWFCKVVDVESISQAARTLRVSKAAVSKVLSSLEQELGVTLLHRTTRAVRPTATGRVVYTHARTVLEQMRELEAAANAEKAEPSGTLRITAPVAFGSLHLRAHIAAFIAKYPAVRIELVLTDRYIRLAEEGFDVAIRVTRSFDDEDVVAVPLARTRMIACASPEYLARAGKPRTPRDLARHPSRYTCISYAAPGVTGRLAWHFDDEAVLIDPAVRVDNSVLLCDLARSGAGIAFLLSFVCAADLANGTLIPLFPKAKTEQSTVFALYPSPGHATAKIRAFMEFLKSAYMGVGEWA
ncbi:LysR substrate-binding domain-containing protein [Pendulispora rubella]|uniref:LysR substrate-binding domain-containing protein n=1 Tax=Pendulispora rubella TaxID=2741070 RepID=A0ABZ2KZ31_9BACT